MAPTDLTLVELFTAQKTVRRAAKVSGVVGTILVLINQWEAVVGNGSINGLKIILTYMVPYCVSSYSTVMAHIDKNN